MFPPLAMTPEEARAPPVNPTQSRRPGTEEEDGHSEGSEPFQMDRTENDPIKIGPLDRRARPTNKSLSPSKLGRSSLPLYLIRVQWVRTNIDGSKSPNYIEPNMDFSGPFSIVAY